MNDDEIREAARVFRGMTLEEVDRFTALLMEPKPMTLNEMIKQINAAEVDLVSTYNVAGGLAEFAGDILRLGLVGTQSEAIKIESIIANKRTIRQGAKLIVRTHPVRGTRWFASLNTWREGDQ